MTRHGSQNGPAVPEGAPKRRGWSYAALALALAPGAAVVTASGWTGSTHLHTVVEAVATVLALVIGLMSFVHYRLRRTPVLLCLAAGFPGVALLDGYHAVVTSEWFGQSFPSPPAALVPWSWMPSRLLLSLLMVLAWWVGQPGWQARPSQLAERSVYVAVAALTVASFVLFALVPLPPAHFPGAPLGRPQELVPAVLLAAALLAYLRRGRWRGDPLEHWLVVSLILALVAQAGVMSQSRRLFDAAFDFAHLLKITGYAVILGGLVASLAAEFRAMEEARRETLGKLAQLFEGVPVGLFRLAADGRTLTEVNLRFARMLGFGHPHEIEGESIFEYMDDGEQRRRWRAIDPRDTVLEYLTQLRRKDGTALDVELNAGPVLDGSGRPLLYQGSIQDVTEREMTRELKRSNAELQQFAYVASHDLQEPLRTIVSYVQLIERRYRDRFDEDGLEFLGFVVDSSKRAQTLIDDLLRFSRVGTRARSLLPVEVEATLSRALDNLASTIAETRAAVTRDPLPAVLGDENQLVQLLQNLIGNAIKFHGPREPRVHVSAIRSDSHWVLSVRDEGIGIESRYFERIFTIFQRLHPQRDYPGTGIGLAICRKIVERHGGRIWVESQPGAGSTFFFTLPALEAPQPALSDAGAARPAGDQR